MTCAAFAISSALAAVPSVASAQERVQFPSADGELNSGAPTQLDGFLYRSADAAPLSAVVAMHGCGGLFTSPDRSQLAPRNVDWGTRLSALGYAVLFPDSFNPRGTPEVCKQDQTVVRPGLHRVADAYGALAWLQKQPFARPGAIALMGWSHGGVTTLWASKLSSRARPKDVQTDFALGIAMYPGCSATLEKDYIAAFPVHMFVGDRDDWTPAAPCKAFAEKANLKIVAYPNAHHGFDSPNQEKLVVTGLRSAISGTATFATDPEARADVIKRVPAILATMQGR